ncbi:MAG: type II secretion system GspH family protein [Phycisphaerales bacterium]|nr:type II secretion system GspH family protein [Phycisphaerales bacterium]
MSIDRRRHAVTRFARRGFTLIEILIVVLILAILAAIVIPSFGTFSKEARQVAFISDARIFGDGILVYMAKSRMNVPNGNTGELPAELEPYIDPAKFAEITPIGGRWDTEADNFGIFTAVGVHFNGDGETQNDDYMLEVDSLFDDRGLFEGNFQKLDDGRYYFILDQ